jgi:hypothetical protein
VKGEKRSPIKDKPLRLPGQSLQEERDKLYEDKIEQPALFVALLFVIMVLEWWRSYSGMKPSPALFTLVFVLALGFFAWRVWRLRPKLRALRQGLEGERVVGQFLERLREQGYQVFHDLIGEGFNVDHVAVGPAGVFTIETKTWSKPARGEPLLEFDGERLVAAGYEPERDPIVQAKAQASWLQRLVEETAGRRVRVRPVVVFPGWFVKQSKGSTREVWVLEPKALPGFLAHEAVVLPPDDVKLISFHLSRFIRAGQAPRS